MKDFHLRFYNNRWFDRIADLLSIEVSEIVPSTPGAYVLGTSDGTKLVYPWGNSPVFYIGKSDDLRYRLTQHRADILGAIREHDEYYWLPRQQYGAAFGTSVAWYTAKGKQNPNSLEADLINQFYDSYGSIPVANGAWPSGRREPAHGAGDD